MWNEISNIRQRQERMELAVEKVDSLFAFIIFLVLFSLKFSLKTPSPHSGGDVPELTDGRVALLEHLPQARVLQAVGKRAVRIVTLPAVAAADADSPTRFCRQLCCQLGCSAPLDCDGPSSDGRSCRSV